MKRLNLILALAFLCGIANAQTQQGIVKTPTRRNVDGTWRQGQFVPDATVSVRFTAKNAEQSYRSGDQGDFSFAAQSTFYVTSVVANKGSYTFLDADFSKKERRYSTNVMEVLVDDPELLSKVREEAEAHERKKIIAQIRAKEDEIEELKESNKISTAEYNNMLEQLSEYRKSSEAIVKELAQVYVTTDFGNMDDFNRQLLAFVEDGDFVRADSLLKTKGSKEEEFARIKSNEAAIKKTKEELQLAEKYNEIDKLSFANRLHSEYLMYYQKPLMQDSALYCLKMRADLDTTNMEAVREYAELCFMQKEYIDCEKYYHICLRSYVSNNDLPSIADIQSCLGALYLDAKDFAKSEEYYQLALKNFEKLFKQNENFQTAFNLAKTYLGLASLSFSTDDYEGYKKYTDMVTSIAKPFKDDLDSFQDESIELSNLPNLPKLSDFISNLFMFLSKGVGNGLNFEASNALRIIKNLEEMMSSDFFVESPSDLAEMQSMTGGLYFSIDDYANSIRYFELALNNYEQLFEQNPDAYRKDLADTQNNLGLMYSCLNDYANSISYYELALENYEQLFEQNPDAYRKELAVTQNSLGLSYRCLNDFTNSKRYYELALGNYEQLFKLWPKVYRADLADTQNSLGKLCISLEDYANSKKYYELALGNYEQLFKQKPKVYKANLATVQKNLGDLCITIEDYANSKKYYELAMENYERLFKQDPDTYRKDLALMQDGLGNLYRLLGDNASSKRYYELALKNFELLFKQNPNDYRGYLAAIQDALGLLCYYSKDYASSEKYLKSSIENWEQLVDENPNVFFRDKLAISYYCMTLLYVAKENVEQFDKYLAKAMEVYMVLYELEPNKYANMIIELQDKTVMRMLMKGEIDDAIKLAETTLAIDESNEMSKYSLAECYNNKAYEYAKNSDFSNAYHYIDKATSLCPNNANFYDSKGEILLKQGKNAEALEMWKKVLELNPNFLNGYPDGTNLSNGLKALGLIE